MAGRIAMKILMPAFKTFNNFIVLESPSQPTAFCAIVYCSILVFNLD